MAKTAIVLGLVLTSLMIVEKTLDIITKIKSPKMTLPGSKQSKFEPRERSSQLLFLNKNYNRMPLVKQYDEKGNRLRQLFSTGDFSLSLVFPRQGT
ncbi:hypothetical protein ABE28_009195 [Peribacillus muralis]|uniref:Uncharacterized protein n=1 Tax=Peribacillus muralis TaxID=264697 RepID=A0A1B3XMU2_9BACI|nr:hypothetical protein [Peribacillus muralis]AOH54526.1 hypothetical protein ABE28_009195 [Peribacillus muralis]